MLLSELYFSEYVMYCVWVGISTQLYVYNVIYLAESIITSKYL